MPLRTSPDAPPGGLKIVETRLKQFPREMFLGNPRSPRQVGVAPHPIQVYALPPSKVRIGSNPLSRAVAGSWLYLVVSVPDSVEPAKVEPQAIEIEGGIELVARPDHHAWDIGQIAAGRYYRNFGHVLMTADADLPGDEAVEPRLLDVPGLGCRALWFCGSPTGRGDHFSWLPSSQDGNPGPLITYEKFVEKLRELAPSSPKDIHRSRPSESIPADRASSTDRSRVASFDPFRKQAERSRIALNVQAKLTTNPLYRAGLVGSFGLQYGGSVGRATAFKFGTFLDGGLMGYLSPKEVFPMSTVPPEALETIQNLQALPESDLLVYLGKQIEDFSASQLPGVLATDARALLGGGGNDTDRQGFLSRLGDNFLKRLHRSFYSLICDPSDPDNAKVKAGLDLGVEAGSYTMALIIASTFGLGWGIAIAAATIITKRVFAAGQGAFCETWMPEA